MIGIITKSKKNIGAQQLFSAAKDMGQEACLIYAHKPDLKKLLACNTVIARATSETLGAVIELLTICEKHGIATSPNSRQLRLAFNKCDTYVVLKEHQVAQPVSVTYMPKTQIISLPLPPPYVIKPATGNRGIGVEKCISLASVVATSMTDIYQDNGYIVQEYIEAGGSDKRIFIIADKVVAAMKRKSSNDDFRSNIAIGGTAEFYRCTISEAQLAIAAVRAIGLDFAGVDIIDSSNGPLVLEVNPSPGFKVGEYANINIAKCIIELFSK